VDVVAAAADDDMVSITIGYSSHRASLDCVSTVLCCRPLHSLHHDTRVMSVCNIHCLHITLARLHAFSRHKLIAMWSFRGFYAAFELQASGLTFSLTGTASLVSSIAPNPLSFAFAVGFYTQLFIYLSPNRTLVQFLYPFIYFIYLFIRYQIVHYCN